MSRCFPYRPSGYVRNEASSEALIESIKLQREREKAKTERTKEKKREKKGRGKEKKKKEEKLNDIGDGKVKKLYSEKFFQEEKYRADSIKGYLQKGRENEAEQLEKSGLTEEHEQPISSQNLCYLSDSTQSSNKRKRDNPPYNGSQNHGNIIRIRLPLKKHREPDALLNSEQLSSTSGKADSLAQLKNGIVQVPGQEQCCSVNAKSNIVAEEVTLRCDKDLPNSAPGKEIFSQDSAETAIGTNLYKNEKQRPESLYKILIEDWVPPPLELEQKDLDDEEWLFGTKQQDRHVPKKFKAGNDVSSCGNPTSWPRAQFLPNADIYALPYTVPF